MVGVSTPRGTVFKGQSIGKAEDTGLECVKGSEHWKVENHWFKVYLFIIL